jgi:hypothetical protein
LALYGGAASAQQCNQQTGISITPISTSTPALSIYHLGDTPRLTVATSQSISLSAVDYWGKPVSLGATTNSTGSAWTVSLPAQNKIGYFELTATASGGAVGCLQYAVVPSSAPDKRFGMTTQMGFSNPVGLEAALTAAGIGAVKDSISWQSAVSKVGAPITVPATFDSYMSLLARDNITPLLTLAFGNPLYEPSGSGVFTLPFGNVVSGQTDISGYAAYAVGMANRYGNPGLGVELWNEVDGTFCQGTACSTLLSRAAAYSTLSKAASTALRAGAKVPTIVGGATYGAPLPWFEDLFYTGVSGGCPSVISTATPATNGLLTAIDQVDVHWYSRPEDLDQALQDLTTLTTRCGHAKPIVATEVGAGDWRSPADGYVTAMHQTPAELVRDAAVLMGRGVSAMYTYVLNDVTVSITGDPENMLVSENKNQLYVPTAGYAGYANLIAQMAGMTAQKNGSGAFVGSVAPDNRSKIYAFVNTSAGSQVYIGWSVPEFLNADLNNANPADISFKATGTTTISDVMGQQIATYTAGSTVSLSLTASPVYIAVQGTAPLTFTSTDVALLASSADDFGTAYPAAIPTTGNNNWSYGYIKATTGGASSVTLGFQAGFKPATWSDGSWIIAGSSLVFSQTNQAPFVGYIGTTKMSGWAIRRWTCPSTGPACSVAISGQAQLGSAQSAGVSVLVVANDAVQYLANLVPANGVAPGVSISSPSNPLQPLLVTVQPGKPIDFAVTTGPGAIVAGYDSTTLYVWIANAPAAVTSQVKGTATTSNTTKKTASKTK